MVSVFDYDTFQTERLTYFQERKILLAAVYHLDCLTEEVLCGSQLMCSEEN